MKSMSVSTSAAVSYSPAAQRRSNSASCGARSSSRFPVGAGLAGLLEVVGRAAQEGGCVKAGSDPRPSSSRSQERGVGPRGIGRSGGATIVGSPVVGQPPDPLERIRPIHRVQVVLAGLAAGEVHVHQPAQHRGAVQAGQGRLQQVVHGRGGHGAGIDRQRLHHSAGRSGRAGRTPRPPAPPPRFRVNSARPDPGSPPAWCSGRPRGCRRAPPARGDSRGCAPAPGRAGRRPRSSAPPCRRDPSRAGCSRRRGRAAPRPTPGGTAGPAGSAPGDAGPRGWSGSP